MAKRKRGFTQQKYNKWLKEERGQGAKEEYKPWLKIQDVPSKGSVTRLHGIKTNRQHELFSKLEKYYFLILEFSDNVVDIREQYPLLYREETLNIANKLNIKHPKDPKTDEYTVMTTDFLITINDNGQEKVIARTIKQSEELENKRVIEKFEIERQYWKQKEIDWAIVTDKEINKVFASNIEQLRIFNNLKDKLGLESIEENEINDLLAEFSIDLNGKSKTVRDIASEFEQKMLLQKGTGIALFKHLLYTKHIKVNLLNKLDIDTPQDIILLKEINHREVQYI